MNENLKKLFEEIRKDDALVEKFKQCKTAEEAYAVAKSVVDGYTIEEFKEIMIKIDNAAKTVNSELSDDDLDQVAGGLSTGDWLLIGGSAAGGVATITAGVIGSAAGGV